MKGYGIHKWRRKAYSYLTLLLFLFFGNAIYAEPIPLPIPCSVPPQIAATTFFELFESPGHEINIRSSAEKIFSERLLSTQSIEEILYIIKRAKNEYGIDRFDAPLKERLIAPPQLSNRGERDFASRGGVSLRLLALSPRGKVEQHISMTCESLIWKVEGISYGPPSKWLDPP